MWSVYSTAKFLFLLLLVEASLARFVRSGPFRPQCIATLHTRYENSPTLSSNKTCLHSPRYWNPDGNVTIRWDIMNETRGGYYMANVTIFNYLKYQDIQGPWSLKWIWVDDEILLSTVGAKSSNFTLRDDMNRITIVDLPPLTDDHDDAQAQRILLPTCRKIDDNNYGSDYGDAVNVHVDADVDYDDDGQRIVPIRCKGDVIPWFKEEEEEEAGGDLEKSSFSFQIAVGRANLKYHPPATDVTLNTPELKYRCDQLVKVTGDHLNTWSTSCVLSFFRVYISRQI